MMSGTRYQVSGMMCVCSFYPSTSSTTSVRADSLILLNRTEKRYKFCGYKATPQRYYVATYQGMQ